MTCRGRARSRPRSSARCCRARYLVTKKVGQGGMGAVYEATHTLIGKRVAVKVLLEKYAQREAIVARLKKEAQLASSIGNEHIIDITDIGNTEDGRTFVVMEYLEGESLAECLSREHELTEQRTLTDRVASGVGARRRTRQGHRPPRHQAGEPVPAEAQGSRTSSRSSTSASRSRCARAAKTKKRSDSRRPAWCWARRCTCRRSRRAATRTRSPRRHLRARRDHVRGAGRARAVRRQQLPLRDLAGAQRRAQAAARAAGPTSAKRSRRLSARRWRRIARSATPTPKRC